jgi:glycogen operon protein
VIYECHVKGITKLHPEIDPALRGTYRGLAQPPMIEHLAALGVTAVELLPVQHAADEARLRALGLTNYWGYNPLGWFAPDERFATAPGRQGDEFREMVRGLHAAGIEVILDVVFNHTAEGALPRSYYRHDEHGARVDWTGCGNTVDFSRREVRRLVHDCILWWVQELHVDGFRFDLAVTLGRGGRLLEELAADPRLRGVKLIAEPWDLGPDGYRLGRFPPGWSQWNDRYRDAVRGFWSGVPGTAPELAARLSGSVDLVGSPSAGINYICCHDGFTLHDLVRFDRKHNDANGENGRDGSDHNLNRNFGSRAPVVARSLMATLALSRGVPMIGGGDEQGRTQHGNNNAYCHDSELVWVDWEGADRSLRAFVQEAFAVRRRFPELRADEAYDPGSVRWFDAHGCELDAGSWRQRDLQAFALRIGEGLTLLLNAADSPVGFELPGGAWTVQLDSAGGTRPGRLDASTLQFLSR